MLALAAQSDTIARGVLLLAIYSAGLAIPFLLAAIGIVQFLKFYQRFRKYLPFKSFDVRQEFERRRPCGV